MKVNWRFQLTRRNKINLNIISEVKQILHHYVYEYV